MQLIDRSLAVSTAKKFILGGPNVAKADAQRDVDVLREAAEEALPQVLELTGLDVADRLGDSETLVVDRFGWLESNLTTMPLLFGDALEEFLEDEPKAKKYIENGTAAKTGGIQAGGLLSYFSTRVLGQFDPFTSLENPETGEPVGPGGGRLMLVAPNIAKVRRAINASAKDFALWVCLHEQTHLVQFNAAPWLKERMITYINEVVAATRGENPEKVVSEKVDEITAMMALLEGHANHIMDGVDKKRIPTVRRIRRKFNEYGKTANPVAKIWRKIVGLEAKSKQYKDGQSFVDAVVEAVGLQEFNKVFSGPELFPTKKELHDPEAWVERTRSARASI